MNQGQPVGTVGIVGCGRIGNLYARLIVEEGAALGLELTAAADPQSRLDLPGVAHFSNAEELIRAGIDTVIIATPPDRHYSIAKQALQAGKHVLIEKPPAASVEEAELLVSTARDNNRALFFAYHARYNESALLARKALAGATVAKVGATYRENVLNYHDPHSWVFREGVLKDSGINALSVVVYVLPAGQIADIADATFVRSTKYGAITEATLALTLNGLEAGTVLLDWTHTGGEERTVAIGASAAEFVIDIVADRLLRNGEVVHTTECRDDRLTCEYRRMLGDFADHIRTGRSSTSLTELRIVQKAGEIGRVVEGA